MLVGYWNVFLEFVLLKISLKFIDQIQPSITEMARSGKEKALEVMKNP